MLRSVSRALRLCWIPVVTALPALPHPVAAQPALTRGDIQQIVSTAVRAALADARVGERGQTSDSAIVFDTASLHLSNRARDRTYEAAPLTSLTLGRAVRATTRDAAFDCPARDVPPRISPDCVPRANRTYVSVHGLEIDSPNRARLWVSILAPGKRGPGVPRNLHFVVHTVEMTVQRTASGWTLAKPGRMIAG